MKTLEKIAKTTVTQGYYHRQNIISFYKTLIDAARKEFTEDNKTSLDSFLRECHEEALKEK